MLYCVEDIALQNLQIFSFIVLCADIFTIFEPKVVTISARIFRTLQYFSTKFWNLLLLKGSFREFRFFHLDLSRSKIIL